MYKLWFVINVHSVQVVVAVVYIGDLVCMVCKCTAVCHVLLGYIQWNLRIKDNLGPGILSVVRRLVSLGGQPIFSLKMP